MISNKIHISDDNEQLDFFTLYDEIEDDICISWNAFYLSQKAKQKLTPHHIRFDTCIHLFGREININLYGTTCPSDRDIFKCIISDSRAWYHNKDYKEFYANYKDEVEDTNDLKIIYILCKKNAKQLKYLLGKHMFKQFMKCNI